MKECLACGACECARTFTAREYLFSTSEQFTYFQCGRCGSLQISHIPDDISKYYPDNYYSMTDADVPIEQISKIRRIARAARSDFCINGLNLSGWIITKIAPDYSDLDWNWFRRYASTKSRILDVGCGQGNLLRKMREQGFCNLTGVDPFITSPMVTEGLRILRGELTDLDETFDFVMLHHSLEHVPNPLSTLNEVRRLLQPGGVALIRVPIAGSYAERHYGADWIGLDPPRHLFVPSRAGMAELARRAGFRVERYWYDTSDWVLLLSEARARGLRIYDREDGRFTLGTSFTNWEVNEARGEPLS